MDVTPDLIELFNISQASISGRTVRVELGSVQEAENRPSINENNQSRIDSYFEEGLHHLGANVELLSATTHFQLFSVGL